jgi:hypothetical protein
MKFAEGGAGLVPEALDPEELDPRDNVPVKKS